MLILLWIYTPLLSIVLGETVKGGMQNGMEYRMEHGMEYEMEFGMEFGMEWGNIEKRR